MRDGWIDVDDIHRARRHHRQRQGEKRRVERESNVVVSARLAVFVTSLFIVQRRRSFRLAESQIQWSDEMVTTLLSYRLGQGVALRRVEIGRQTARLDQTSPEQCDQRKSRRSADDRNSSRQ